MITFSKILEVSVGVVLILLMIVSLLAAQVQASNSGLRVVVTVENVPSYVVGEVAGITVTTASDMAIYRAVIIPDADSLGVQ